MQLTTPRLILREFRESDLDALYDMFRRADFQRYEGPVLTREDTEKQLRLLLEDARAVPRRQYRFAVTIPPEDIARGRVSLWPNNAGIGEWEIGWKIHPNCWGQGYATEAARELMRYAFTHLGVRRIVAFCHAENLASLRVMEKLGMQREAHLRQVRWLDGKWNDEFACTILKEEFS